MVTPLTLCDGWILYEEERVVRFWVELAARIIRKKVDDVANGFFGDGFTEEGFLGNGIFDKGSVGADEGNGDAEDFCQRKGAGEGFAGRQGYTHAILLEFMKKRHDAWRELSVSEGEEGAVYVGDEEFHRVVAALGGGVMDDSWTASSIRNAPIFVRRSWLT